MDLIGVSAVKALLAGGDISIYGDNTDAWYPFDLATTKPSFLIQWDRTGLELVAAPQAAVTLRPVVRPTVQNPTSVFVRWRSAIGNTRWSATNDSFTYEYVKIDNEPTLSRTRWCYFTLLATSLTLGSIILSLIRLLVVLRLLFLVNSIHKKPEMFTCTRLLVRLQHMKKPSI